MRTLIEIYFGINLFVTAYWLGDRSGYQRTKRERNIMLLSAFVSALFLIPKIVLQLLYDLFLKVWHKVPYYDTINFYLAFYIRRDYRNLSEEVLEAMNAQAKKRSTKSFSDRVFRKAIALINRRNNYTYNPTNGE